VESICNPYDLVGVEAAVRLVEEHGGKVTVISMGPPQAESALRECLSLGANDACLLSDRAFAGADTLATSYTLSQAVRKLGAEEPVDLIICGKQAIDGDTAQTGPGIATWLDYTQLTYVTEITAVDKDGITVRREIEGGSEIIRGKFPALLTVELELGEIRYASLPELIRALRQEIKVWGAAEIEAAPEKLGLKGSPTSVREIFAPPVRGGGTVYDTRQNKEQAVEECLQALFEKDKALMEEIMSADGHAQE
jgi:electron transfer flavoprotein beta subunit